MSRVDATTDITRAIRRSRKARAAMRRRRHRSAAILGLLAATLTGGGIWSIGALTGNDMVEAAVAKAQDLADLIGRRSPGERTEAHLTKTKHAEPLAEQRLAAAQHQTKPAVARKVAMTDIAKLLEAPPIAAPPAQLPLTTSPPTLGTIIGPPSGGGIPGGGGGTPGGGATPSSFPGPESKIPVSVPSAVPEPGTWTTMLLGFGLIGWRIRSANSAPIKALA